MANLNEKKAFLVLGMHRSGTSAMTAGLNRTLGVCLGDIQNPSGKQNPKGFFENFVIVRFNDRVLQSIDAAWDSFGAGKIIDFSAPAFIPYKKEALELLKKYYGNCKIWVMKDPRISLLLPFWEEVIEEFESTTYRLIALRHPLEIALSQQVRKEHSSPNSISHLCGDDLRYMLNLWYWYNIRLLKSLPDDNNIVVTFERLLADPDNEMQRIGQLLGIEPDVAGLKEYGESFLKKQFRHHEVGEAEVEPYLKDYGHVFDLYSRLKCYADKNQLLRDDVPGILDGMPDDRILQSWTAPIYSYIHTVRFKLTESTELLAPYRKELERIKGSRLWRYTAPLRKLGNIIKKGKMKQ